MIWPINEMEIHIHNKCIWRGPHGRVGRTVKGEIKLIIVSFHVNMKQNICCGKEACAYT